MWNDELEKFFRHCPVVDPRWGHGEVVQGPRAENVTAEGKPIWLFQVLFGKQTQWVWIPKPSLTQGTLTALEKE